MNIETAELKKCIAHGLDLIPLHPWDKKIRGRPMGKAPRDQGWPKARYTGSAIKDWIKKGGNIGVRLTASQLVVDIDPKHKDAEHRSAQQLLEDLELELGIDLSEAPVVETGSGGYHVYLERPGEGAIHNKIDTFGGAIEFKSRGRQVVAAGSKHPNGEHYRWIRNADSPFPTCPPELWGAIRKPETKDDIPPDPVDLERIQACLELLNPTDFREYEKWRNLLFSVHSAASGDTSAREAFVQWSTRDPQYADARSSIEGLWDAVKNTRGRTAKSLYWFVAQAGQPIPVDLGMLDAVDEEKAAQNPVPVFQRQKDGRIKHTIADNVVAACFYLGLGIKRDLFNDKAYLIDRDGLLDKHFDVKAGVEVTDTVVNMMALTVTREINGWAGDPSAAIMERAQVAITETCHGLREWLDSLKWDGQPRMSTWLIQVSDLKDTKYNRAVSRLLLRAAVARVYRPGIKFDEMIVMEGPQGGNKSTLVHYLAAGWGEEGLPTVTASSYKDVVGVMRGKWIIEVAEMDAMRKAEVDHLKAFLSRREDRVRLPYERNPRTIPRQCIFVGTTNDAEYLRDITGNRRFLPLPVGTIQDPSEIARDQLWAEAVADFKLNPPGNKVTFDSKLWSESAEMQESRRITDPWEDRLAELLNVKWAEHSEVSSEAVFFEGLQIPIQRATTADARRLSRIMQRLGWRRDRIRQNGAQVRGYRRIVL